MSYEKRLELNNLTLFGKHLNVLGISVNPQVNDFPFCIRYGKGKRLVSLTRHFSNGNKTEIT